METMHTLLSQQQPTGALSIDQLLRAAKLIEQRATIEKLLINQPLDVIGTHQFGTLAPSTAFHQSTKLGEDYQERILASKIRSVLAEPGPICGAAPNSTGSSRRSSPVSVSSSAPNSPETSNLLLMANQQQPQAVPTTSEQSAPNAVRVNNVRPTSATSSNCSGRRVSGSRQSRAAHNELEKNRRANLRGHLEALKSVLPPEADSHRDTTLSLLTRARNFIQFLREQKASLAEKRAELLAEHLQLRELLQQGGNVQPVQHPIDDELPAPKPIFLASPVPNFEFQTEDSDNDSMERTESMSAPAEVVPEKPDRMEFLALHGLLPALPLLYPYSSPAMQVPANSPALC